MYQESKRSNGDKHKQIRAVVFKCCGFSIYLLVIPVENHGEGFLELKEAWCKLKQRENLRETLSLSLALSQGQVWLGTSIGEKYNMLKK